MRAKYYNLRLGPTILRAFEKKGYVVLFVWEERHNRCDPLVEGSKYFLLPELELKVKQTLLIDGHDGVIDSAEVHGQIENKPEGVWHLIESKIRRVG